MILILYLFLSIRSSSFHFNHRLSEEENSPPLQPTLRYYGWFEHTPCFVRLLIAILILVMLLRIFFNSRYRHAWRLKMVVVIRTVTLIKMSAQF